MVSTSIPPGGEQKNDSKSGIPQNPEHVYNEHQHRAPMSCCQEKPRDRLATF